MNISHALAKSTGASEEIMDVLVALHDLLILPAELMILEVRPVLDLVHLLLPEHAKLLLVLLREVVRLHVIRRELLLLELLAHELLLVRLLRRGSIPGWACMAPAPGMPYACWYIRGLGC